MSARTGIKPAMEHDTFLDRIFSSIAGRMIIAALQTFLVSQALLLVFVFRQVVEVEILKYTIVVCVGLTAGFSARRTLTGHTRVLELLTAILAAALSLGTQHALTGGFIGILPFPGTSRYPAWDSLIQLGAAALAAALVVFAFRIPRQAAKRRRWIPTLRFSRGGQPVPDKTQSKIKESALAVGKVSLSAPAREIKRPARKKKSSRRGLAIQFIGEEEHTCPYCLDAVEKGDPRGVKICPICKTWHHADCWGITGACQIPHMHEK